jgi:RHS repeat-associated protein
MYDDSVKYALLTHKFTGKERDAESGLDNFEARYMSSSLGRFMSADDSKYINPADPQTFNLYSYVANNPLNAIDPTGHDPVGGTNCHTCHMPILEGSGETPESGDLADSESEHGADITYTQNCVQDLAACEQFEMGQEHAAQQQYQNQMQAATRLTTNLEQEEDTPTSGPNDSGAAATGTGENAQDQTQNQTGDQNDQQKDPPTQRVGGGGNPRGGGGGKGERNWEGKPPKGYKGARPIRDGGGKIVGWSIPSPDGKRIKKSLDWGKVNGLDPATFQQAAKGAAIVGTGVLLWHILEGIAIAGAPLGF